MKKGNILCYKLCYCLGVPNEGLHAHYRVTHSAALQIKYFDRLSATQTYRALARVYFILIKHNHDFATMDTLDGNLEVRLQKHIANAEVDIRKIFRERKSFVSCLNQLAREANNLLPRIYEELKPGIEYCDFARLLTLADTMSMRDVYKVKFAMQMTPQFFNIYFFADPIYNYSSNEMLSSDAKLLERIALHTGEQGKRLVDSSDLATCVEENKESHYLRLEQLTQYTDICVDDSTCTPEVLDAIDSLNSDYCCIHHYETLTDCIQQLPDNTSPDNTLLVFRWTLDNNMNDVRWLNSRVAMLLVMPVKRELYRGITTGEYANTYLLSIKNSNIRINKRPI